MANIFLDHQTWAVARALLNGQVDIVDNKVDKVSGSRLINAGEVAKLASLSEHFRGVYTTLSALQTAIPTGVIGDYALVDLNNTTDSIQYIWDGTDNEWVTGVTVGGGDWNTLANKPFTTDEIQRLKDFISISNP